MIAILDSDKSVGETINIGSGYEISVGDTVKLIGELTGKTLEVKTDDARIRPANSEVERLCCDASKLKSLIGWQPKHAGHEGLKRGLEASIAWFAKPENRAHYHDVHRYVV